MAQLTYIIARIIVSEHAENPEHWQPHYTIAGIQFRNEYRDSSLHWSIVAAVAFLR